MRTIALTNIYNSDLFSRNSAKLLSDSLSKTDEDVVLDFNGISFISRSFADELYNIIDSCAGKNISFSHRNETVKSTMDIVLSGRNRERRLGIPHAEMYSFESMSALSGFLQRNA